MPSTLTSTQLRQAFHDQRDELSRRWEVDGYPRETLEALREAGTAKHFARLCIEERVLQGLATRAVSGVEPVTTLTWLLDLLEPSPEALSAAFLSFVQAPWHWDLPEPRPEVVTELVSVFAAAGADVGESALDAALQCGDVREAYLQALAEALRGRVDAAAVARCALRRITGCRGRDSELANIAWLLEPPPPEEGLELGFALAALLSLSDEVRALTASFDPGQTARASGRWALGAGVVGTNRGPVMVDITEGDDTARIAGRIEQRLDATVAATAQEPASADRDRRLRIARDALAVVRGWERTVPGDGPRSPILDALAQLTAGHPEVEAEVRLVDAGSIPLRQYLDGVEVLRRHVDRLGAWADPEHPLARILGADRSALAAMVTLDPERYPAEAAEVLEGVSHGVIDGVIYAFPFDGEGVHVVAVTLESVSPLGTLQAFVEEGVAALTGAT